MNRDRWTRIILYIVIFSVFFAIAFCMFQFASAKPKDHPDHPEHPPHPNVPPFNQTIINNTITYQVENKTIIVNNTTIINVYPKEIVNNNSTTIIVERPNLKPLMGLIAFSLVFIGGGMVVYGLTSYCLSKEHSQTRRLYPIEYEPDRVIWKDEARKHPFTVSFIEWVEHDVEDIYEWNKKKGE